MLFLFLAALLVESFVFLPNHKGYQVGDKATGFTLKDTENHDVSLNDFKEAKGFILVFICNHCPCSVAYEDRITALDKKYKLRGFPVIALNSFDVSKYPMESLDKMKERALFKKFTFPYLSDADQSMAIAYGAPSTPYVFILAKSENDLIVRYTGSIDDNMWTPKSVKLKYVENALDQLLAGEKVEVAATIAFGCAIDIASKP